MTISSMTGYGDSDGALGASRWAWSAKSVNGRGLDVKIRVPAGFDALEPLARERVKARLKRGSVQFALVLNRADVAAAASIDLLYAEALIRAGQDFVDAGLVEKPRWDGLLLVRGVLRSEAPEDLDAASDANEAATRETLLQGLDAALDKLEASRRKEGAELSRILDALLVRIHDLAIQARAVAAALPADLAAKLDARLAQLGAGLDPQRLAQEAALLAQKADATEELDRLLAHADEARALIAAPEPAGRRLEFLAQELGREANTLCSKSADLALTRLGLDLKTAIDQVREQAANVE